MDVGSLKCSASEAAGAVGCLEWPNPKLVGAVGYVCIFVLLGWLARRLVAVRWFRKNVTCGGGVPFPCGLRR